MRYSIRYNMCVIFRCVLYYTFLWKGFAPFTAFVVSSSKGSKLCMSQRSLSIDEKEVQRELDSLDLILEKLQVQNEVPLHCKLDLASVACDANSNTCHTVTQYWCRKLFSPKKVSFLWQRPEQYLWGFIRTVGYVNLRKRRTSRSQAVHFHIETILKRFVFSSVAIKLTPLHLMTAICQELS